MSQSPCVCVWLCTRARMRVGCDEKLFSRLPRIWTFKCVTRTRTHNFASERTSSCTAKPHSSKGARQHQLPVLTNQPNINNIFSLKVPYERHIVKHTQYDWIWIVCANAHTQLLVYSPGRDWYILAQHVTRRTGTNILARTQSQRRCEHTHTRKRVHIFIKQLEPSHFWPPAWCNFEYK